MYERFACVRWVRRTESVHSRCGLHNTADDKSLQEVLLQYSDFIYDKIGYDKPLTAVKMLHKDDICSSIFLKCTITMCFAELEQLKEGLKFMGFLSMIQEYPDLIKPFFTYDKSQRLSAGKLMYYQLFLNDFIN